MITVALSFDVGKRTLSVTSISTGEDVAGTTGDSNALTFTVTQTQGTLTGYTGRLEFDVEVYDEETHTSYKPYIELTNNSCTVPYAIMKACIRHVLPVQLVYENNSARITSLNIIRVAINGSIDAMEGQAQSIPHITTAVDALTYADGVITVHHINGTTQSYALSSMWGYITGDIEDQDDLVEYIADTISADITEHNSSNSAHSDIRGLIEALTGRVATVEGSAHSHANKALLDTYNQTNENLTDAVSKKHEHANKAILDEIEVAFTSALKTSYDGAVGAMHVHGNKALLDTYTQTEANLSDAVAKKHEHANKALLDTYTQTEANLSDAVAKKHAHSNASILNATQEAFTSALKTTYDGYATGKQDTLLYIPEDVSNKVTSISSPSSGSTKYPTDYAVREFVNSSIASETAHYISNDGQPFTSVAELETYTTQHPGTVGNNDYAIVTGTDAGNTYYDRYKATKSGSTITWAKEYRINNSSFTATQWNAINSGITSALVGNIHTHSNKALLDTYTQTEANLSDAVAKKHSHSNASILDSIDTAFTSSLKTQYDGAVSAKHSHSNKALLDTYTQTEANLADAVSKKHSHSNASILDATTASFTSALKTTYDGYATGKQNALTAGSGITLTGATIAVDSTLYYTKTEVNALIPDMLVIS